MKILTNEEIDDSKVCNTCKIRKPKSDFSRRSSVKSGCQSECKACKSLKYLENRVEIRAKQKENWKKYSEENREKLRERSQQYRKENSEIISKYKDSYIEDNKKKISAKNAVRSKILTNKIEKQPCEVCGNINADAHHDDYDKPLDIRWLCRKHHKIWHIENGEGKNAHS